MKIIVLVHSSVTEHGTQMEDVIRLTPPLPCALIVSSEGEAMAETKHRPSINK